MFGNKSSPTLWGRCAAFLATSVQRMFDPGQVSLHLCVDDSIVQARGLLRDRRLAFAFILLWWSLLGANIEWKKGALGSAVDWIGANLRHDAQFVSVKIKQELLQSTIDVVSAFFKNNVVQVAKLHSLKLSFILGIVPVMRCFITVGGSGTIGGLQCVAKPVMDLQSTSLR